MRSPITCIALCGALALAGCFSPDETLPRGAAAYDLIPANQPGAVLAPYRIGILDKISVRVFQEPELTFEEVQVDSSGNIVFPLIGEIEAAGRTPLELGQSIEYALGQGFIREPYVTIGVVESAAQRVVVEGYVTEPGVYEIAGTSTLLESIARAKGVTEVAVIDEVVVLRVIDGQMAGAVFDLRDIREGRAPDPEIMGGDKIVVGYSGLKGAYRDFLRAAPLLNVFRAF